MSQCFSLPWRLRPDEAVWRPAGLTASFGRGSFESMTFERSGNGPLGAGGALVCERDRRGGRTAGPDAGHDTDDCARG